MHYGWRVVFGVFPLELWIGDDGGAQAVVRVVVRATHTFVDGVGNAPREVLEAHIHADFEEHVDDAGVLANRTMTLGTHFRVGQDLRNRVFSRWRGFGLIGASQMLDVILRVVVANELQRSGNGFNEIGVLDGRGHVDWKRFGS